MKLRYCDGYFTYLDSFNSLWTLLLSHLKDEETEVHKHFLI